MTALLTTFSSLLFDNPIIEKDALIVLRRPRTVVLWVLALLVVAVGVAAVVFEGSHRLDSWGTLSPVGGHLLAITSGLTLLAVTVLVPAFASSTIAGEREHGTLPLLLVSGLSPLQIVIGKLAATLLVAAPFVALCLPVFGVSALVRGVDVGEIVLAAAGIFATTVAAAAVGVAVSSHLKRASVAAPAALVFAGIPGLLCAAPTFGSIISVTTYEGSLHAVAGAALVAAAAITLVSVYVAWSALAPRLAPRFERATQLYMTVTLGLAAIIVPLSGVAGDNPDQQPAVLVATGILLAFVFHFYIVAVACDLRAPAAWRVMPKALLVLGAAGVCLLVRFFFALGDDSVGTNERRILVVLVLQVVATSSIGAVLARLRPQLPLAAVGSGLLMVGFLIASGILIETFSLKDALGTLNFSFTSRSNIVPAVALWSGVSVVSLALSRRRAATG